MSSSLLSFGSSLLVVSSLLLVGFSLLDGGLSDVLLPASLDLGDHHSMAEHLLQLGLVVSTVGVDVMSLQVGLPIQSLCVAITV